MLQFTEATACSHGSVRQLARFNFGQPHHEVYVRHLIAQLFRLTEFRRFDEALQTLQGIIALDEIQRVQRQPTFDKLRLRESQG